MKFHLSHFWTLYDILDSRYVDLKYQKKVSLSMRANRFWRAIPRLRNVLEGSIKAKIKDLDIKFHISNQGVYILDVELRCVVLRLKKKNSVLSVEAKCLWRDLDFERSFYKSYKL